MAPLAPYPTTLTAWRHFDLSPDRRMRPFSYLWERYRELFSQRGYTLFEFRAPSMRPPLSVAEQEAGLMETMRLPDAFHHRIEGADPPVSKLDQQSGMHCPARAPDGTDVLIRLVAMGDEGYEHLKILRFLASNPSPQNHSLPLLAEISHGDMVFVVFPLLRANDELMECYDVRELFDLGRQLLESFTFCHRNLIAHRDFGPGEIIVSTAGLPYFDGVATRDHIRAPFRSLFPVTYYLNDFELGVQYATDSDPASRVVVGIPPASVYPLGSSGDPQSYFKDIAPEALNDQPYCPFKADVFQVAMTLAGFFGNYNSNSGVVALLRSMLAKDPAARPSMDEVLERLIAARAELSEDDLNAPAPPERFGRPWHIKETLQEEHQRAVDEERAWQEAQRQEQGLSETTGFEGQPCFVWHAATEPSEP